MSIKISYNNIVLECDTPEDAVAIAQQLTNSSGKTPLMPGVGEFKSSSVGNEERFRNFCEELSEIQKRLVITVGSSAGMAATDLSATLGVQTAALGAHMSNVAKRAKKHALNLRKCLWTKERNGGRWEFIPSAFLQSAVRDNKFSPARQIA